MGSAEVWTAIISVLTGGGAAQLVHVVRAMRNDENVRETQRDKASIAVGDTLGELVQRLDARVREAEERERRAVLRTADLLHWAAQVQLSGVSLPDLPRTTTQSWAHLLEEQ